jgi:pantoate--beta-alanine ligase
MVTFNSQANLKAHLQSISTSKTTIGFVPTMGALHAGHLSLMAQSLSENTFTVVSVFVNPTQFNNAKDLEKYPRTLDADIEKISSLSKDIIVFAPAVADIYNGKIISEHFDYDNLENQMEGKHRPGHFDGVGTIVKKLFEIVNPNKAYFGEKDFQQLQIVKKLVEKNKMSVKIIGCPIFREQNGLAMSSRNERLSAQERALGSIIFETLNHAKKLFETKSAMEVEKWVENVFKNNTNFRLEYFEIADEATLLKCVRKLKNKTYRGFIAVFANDVRLIDTMQY